MFFLQFQLNIKNTYYRFDYYLERLKNTSINAYNYVVNTWIPTKKMWAASYCLDAVTLGASTAEIIKGVNFSVKESLKKLTSVKEIMTIIYNEAGKQWVYPSISIISSSSLSFPGHSTNNLNNNNNLSEKFKYILEKLTDYAAEMVYKRLTKVDKINIDFTNEQLALCADSSFVYEVDRDNATCSCSFNISSFLPCEHLLKVFMVHGLHKGNVIILSMSSYLSIILCYIHFLFISGFENLLTLVVSSYLEKISR